MGLSQVYQLRGRVGRSNRQGYCYLLKTRTATKKGQKKEESMQKVEGIKSGGFQISMEDLKIRGAGEILGEKQHGTIETFGYDPYLKMLNEEIKKQKGEYREKTENVEIILKEKGFIPENYIEKEERLNIYKRFAILETFEELDELVNEIKDRYGKIPSEMKKFILNIKFKIFAETNGIQIIEEKIDSYRLSFVEDTSGNIISDLEQEFEMKEVIQIPIFEDSNKVKGKEVTAQEMFIIKEVDKKELLEYLNK